MKKIAKTADYSKLGTDLIQACRDAAYKQACFLSSQGLTIEVVRQMSKKERERLDAAYAVYEV